jgi:DNA repair ATPase RecN
MLDILQVGDLILKCNQFRKYYQDRGKLAADHFQLLLHQVDNFQNILDDLSSLLRAQNAEIYIDINSVNDTISACNKLIQKYPLWQDEQRSYQHTFAGILKYLASGKEKADYLASRIKEHKQDLQIYLIAQQM